MQTIRRDRNMNGMDRKIVNVKCGCSKERRMKNYLKGGENGAEQGRREWTTMEEELRER